MKRRLWIFVVLAGVLLPAGMALRAQDRPTKTDLDRMIEEAKKALADMNAKPKKGLVFEQHIYDIRDLTNDVHDFPGKSLNLTPSGGFGFAFFEQEEGEALPFYEGDTIMDMIREYVQPDSWDELRSASVSYMNGVLVVTHTPSVHAEIAEFLAELRSRTASQVTIGVQGIRMSHAALRTVLGNDSANLLGEAGKKRLRSLIEAGDAKEVFAGSVQCVSTQRVNLTELTRHAYLQDYDVEIAEASSIADPIMQEMEEGVVVDVRPVVAGMGKLVILEVRADVGGIDEPMGEIETPLGVIELPRLDLLRIRTTLATPVGSSVVVGGTLSASDDGSMLLVLTPHVHKPGR